MRKCKKCGIEKPEEKFRKKYNKKYNKYYLTYDCIECQNKLSKERAKKWYQSKRGQEIRKKYIEKNYKKLLYETRTRNEEYRKTHREELRKKQRVYYKKNKDKANEYYKNKYNVDHLFKLKNIIRNSVRMSFRRKGKTKLKKATEILGCDMDFLIKYLIKTYEVRYNKEWKWEYLNYVHIDHIKPLKYANTEDDIIKLCHYTNLQLLTIGDNLKKGSKLI